MSNFTIILFMFFIFAIGYTIGAVSEHRKLDREEPEWAVNNATKKYTR